MEHPAKPYQTSTDSFPKNLRKEKEKETKPIYKGFYLDDITAFYSMTTTYSKGAKIRRDSGNDTIDLVQLGCLFNNSQPAFVYVNCI